MTTHRRYRSGLLPAAVESVLAQDFRDFELIVCDDASVDGSAEYLARVAARDERVRVVRHSSNVNSVALSLGRCYLSSSPERPYISWMFDDCVMLPSTLGKLVRGLEREPAEMVFGTTAVRLRDGGVLNVGCCAPDTIRAAVARSPILVPNAGILIQRQVFDKVGWYDPSIVLRRSCDWDLFRRIIGAGIAFSTIPDVLIEESGDLEADSLRNTFTTTFELMARFAAARDSAGVRLDVESCMAMAPDAIPAADWSDEELALMHFMFLEYYLSIGDIERAARWATTVDAHLDGRSLIAANLKRFGDGPRTEHSLMCSGAWCSLVYALFREQLQRGSRIPS